MFGSIGRWFDERLGASRFARTALNKIFPDNWSFMLGEVAMYCFLVLVVTGVYLTFFFHPSAREVVYHGHYAPLDGVQMSEAYRSTIQLSFDVRAGLVFRQIHHWAALLFVASILAHMCRIFFTGAFRKPRELNWVIGVTMLVLAIFNGFAGYSLPDDLLSGTGLRIGFSIALAVPVAGTWLAFLVFGGNFPSEAIIARLFTLHILLIPALIAILLGAHLAILWHQKHTQFPGPGRTEHNIVGSHLWPVYTARSVGLMCAIVSLLCLLGGLAQINPVWLYGPFHASTVSTAAQPDWYMGWLEGALRIFPSWRFHVAGYPISEVFWPAVFLPSVTFGLLYAWPFLEQRVTKDREVHDLLDRPRNRPIRTATGAGVLAFYGVLFVAGSQDIIAQKMGVSIPKVTFALRVLVFVLPALVALLARKICRDLAAEDTQIDTGPADWPPSGVAVGGPADGRSATEGGPHPATSPIVKGATGAIAVAAAVRGAVDTWRRVRRVRSRGGRPR
jgi:ubiquinol-cytochrome c reductase cytochrome b subunit